MRGVVTRQMIEAGMRALAGGGIHMREDHAILLVQRIYRMMEREAGEPRIVTDAEFEVVGGCHAVDSEECKEAQ